MNRSSVATTAGVGGSLGLLTGIIMWFLLGMPKPIPIEVPAGIAWVMLMVGHVLYRWASIKGLIPTDAPQVAEQPLPTVALVTDPQTTEIKTS